MTKIEVTNGDGIYILEQEFHGATGTLIISTKQFSEIAWFLKEPKSARLRSTDAVHDAVVVSYSSHDEAFELAQGDARIYGSRKNRNCGFSQILSMLDQDEQHIPEIQVTNGDGIKILEQEARGSTQPLIVSTKQYAKIAWFLSSPNSNRLKVTDPAMDAVVVTYNKSDDTFTLSQGQGELKGSRKNANCGFSEVLWTHTPSS